MNMEQAPKGIESSLQTHIFNPDIMQPDVVNL